MGRFTFIPYGKCVVRTQLDRPPNNTPLMMMSKAEFVPVDNVTYEKMLSFQ